MLGVRFAGYRQVHEVFCTSSVLAGFFCHRSWANQVVVTYLYITLRYFE